MDNYIKGETLESEQTVGDVFRSLASPGEVTEMKIKAGTKLRNITSFAVKAMKEESRNEIVFSGVGPACNKVVSCAELFKKDFKKTLHQKTEILFQRVEEFWEPQLEGLERLKVNRDVPSIMILFSKKPLSDSDKSQSTSKSGKRLGRGGQGDGRKKGKRGGGGRGDQAGPRKERDPGSNKWARQKKEKPQSFGSAGTHSKNAEAKSTAMDVKPINPVSSPMEAE